MSWVREAKPRQMVVRGSRAKQTMDFDMKRVVETTAPDVCMALLCALVCNNTNSLIHSLCIQKQTKKQEACTNE